MTVLLEWFGCTTFRVRHGSRTIFFDTYLDKAPGVPHGGLHLAEVDEADVAFISHAHFDHVLGADRLALATGALIVGNHETAHLMEANGVPDEQVLAVSGGETVDCGDGITVRALPSVHSCLYASASNDSGASCLGDLDVFAQERWARTSAIFELLPELSEDLAGFFAAASGSCSHRDGGHLAYLLESPDGSLLVNASSGHWSGIFGELRPDVALLAAAGRPNVDGEAHQGSMADFLVEQAALLGDPTVALCHHDPLLPPIMPGVDIREAERRLVEHLGPDRYLTLTYGEPVEILPTRSTP